ncbi:phosphodiester glycosidase family protein [Rubritalea tangerina]|uniref:Phosphodiester glycosidase family protein n=1 Tax=Rubritalea tangerina TaxID=430798 RepID=A0ABW4ZBD4_9BACT
MSACFQPSEVDVSLYVSKRDGIDCLREVSVENLVIATNGGIFDGNHHPLGLCYDGELVTPLNLDEGEGNFYLKPNGVFYLEGGNAFIVESSQFTRDLASLNLAIQSGPLLLDRGQIHPSFRVSSKNAFTRNAIGVKSNGAVCVAYFSEPLNLYRTAMYMRDTLGCESALYLDGAISGVLTPVAGDRLDQSFASILVVRDFGEKGEAKARSESP